MHIKLMQQKLAEVQQADRESTQQLWVVLVKTIPHNSEEDKIDYEFVNPHNNRGYVTGNTVKSFTSGTKLCHSGEIGPDVGDQIAYLQWDH